MKFIPNLTAKQIIWTIVGALVVCFYAPEVFKFIISCAEKTLRVIPKW